MYTVFRRNDGFVHAVASDTAEQGRARLAPYKNTSFDILLQTDDWAAARQTIEDSPFGGRLPDAGPA